MKPRMKRNGNGLLAVVIVILVAATMATAFYELKHNDSRSTVTGKTDSSKNQSNAIPQQKTQYFSIKEWNVQAPYSGSAGFTYSFQQDNPSSVWVNSAQLATADLNCKIQENAGNVGYIGRYLPGDAIPTEGPRQLTAQQYLGQDFTESNTTSPAYSKVGDYYYIYWSGQNACPTSNESTLIYSQAVSDIKKIVESFRATN